MLKGKEKKGNSLSSNLKGEAHNTDHVTLPNEIDLYIYVYIFCPIIFSFCLLNVCICKSTALFIFLVIKSLLGM